MKKIKRFWEEFKAFISHLNDQLEKDNPYDKRSSYKDKKQRSVKRNDRK